MEKNIITNFKNDQDLNLDSVIIYLVKLLEEHSGDLGTVINDSKLSNSKGVLLLMKDLTIKDNELSMILTITSSFENSVNLKMYLIKNDNEILNEIETNYVAYENLLEQIVILMNDIYVEVN